MTNKVETPVPVRVSLPPSCCISRGGTSPGTPLVPDWPVPGDQCYYYGNTSMEGGGGHMNITTPITYVESGNCTDPIIY